jgi:peptidoglycan/LPS O-acetylase OafA/YrhL
MRFHLSWLLPNTLRQVAHFGWTGVDLFFVLSGFLIGSQLLKSHQNGSRSMLSTFYRRRLFRILPAYLVVLTLYFAWPAFREDDGISPLWQFLTFTENLFVDYTRNHAFSHVWSLCIEEQFYLVLPLILLLMLRRPSFKRTVLLLTSLLAIGIAIRTYVFFHVLVPLGPEDFGAAYIQDLYYPTWSRMDGLLAGVVLALIKFFRPTWWQTIARHGHTTLVTGSVLAAISLWLFNDRFISLSGAAAWGAFIGFPILSAGLALIVASAVSHNGLLCRFAIPGAKFLATLAFTLYLSHKAVAHLVRIYAPNIAAPADARAFFVIAVSCVAAAALLHFAVERPFLLLRDRLDHTGTRAVEDQMRLDPAL